MFYDRFIELCSRKGVSPTRAAIDAGISKSLVSKWKANASKEPSPDIVRKLAEYFGISKFEVLEDIPIKKEEAPLLAERRKRKMDDEELKFALWGDVGNIDDDDLEDVRRYAAFIWEKEKGSEKMTELLALYRLAEQEHIAVDCYRLKKREALSLMDAEGNCFIAIDPFQLKDHCDERVKLGHELGHCATGSFYNQWSAFDVREKHENRADRWAIQALVTEEELDDAVAAGHTDLWSLAEHFGVTEAFIRKAVCLYTYGNLATEMYF